MKFIKPEIEFDEFSVVDLITASSPLEETKPGNTGYTDANGDFWTPRY